MFEFATTVSKTISSLNYHFLFLTYTHRLHSAIPQLSIRHLHDTYNIF